jgi:hypothetical protein
MRVVLVLVASALLGGCYAYPAYPVYGGGYAAAYVAPAPVVVARPYYRPYYAPYGYRYWR